MRKGQRPDGVCLVVGTCSRGFDPSQNTTGTPLLTNKAQPHFSSRLQFLHKLFIKPEQRETLNPSPADESLDVREEEILVPGNALCLTG